MTSEERAQHAEAVRRWRAKNPAKALEIARRARKKWKANHYAQHREAQRQHRYAVRREILDLLGGQHCVHCGYDKDWRALQVDHIHGGGKHDKRTNVGSGNNHWAFRNWLKKHPLTARKIYQVLCCNCNWIKRFEQGEGPGGCVTVNQG